MKKTVFCIIILLVLTVFSYTQDNGQTKSLFKRSLVQNWGGYGSIEGKYANVVDDNLLYVGLKGAAISNRNFAFGVAFGGFKSSSTFEGPNQVGIPGELELTMGYGGVFGEYIGWSSKKVHFTIPVLVGIGGGAIMEESGSEVGISDENMVEATGFFVLEPGLNLEVNIFSEIRLFVGPSYRIISNNNFDSLTNQELTGFCLSFGIKYGSF